MNERLIQLIEALHYSPSHFADEVGVIRSSISHILTGRNKPGVDLIQKVLIRFPEVSAEWLLTGMGEMMKGAAAQPVSAPPVVPQEELPITPAKPKEMRQMTLDDYAPPLPEEIMPRQTESSQIDQTDISALSISVPGQSTAAAVPGTAKSAIKRITVFFADNTFQDFIPG